MPQELGQPDYIKALSYSQKKKIRKEPAHEIREMNELARLRREKEEKKSQPRQPKVSSSDLLSALME